MQKTYKRIASGVVGVVGCLVLMVAFAACKPEPNVQPTPTGWVAGNLIVAGVEAALAKPRVAYVSQSEQRWQLMPGSVWVYEDKVRGVICYRYKDSEVMDCVR